MNSPVEAVVAAEVVARSVVLAARTCRAGHFHPLTAATVAAATVPAAVFVPSGEVAAVTVAVRGVAVDLWGAGHSGCVAVAVAVAPC